MKKCLLCGQDFIPATSFLRIFSFKKFHEQCLCQHCLAKFAPISGEHCKICYGKAAVNELCLDCLEWQKIYRHNLLHNHAVYRYNDAFHEIMVSYKRYGDYVLREVLQELCFEQLKKIKADFYVPIPTSPEHITKRQFDTVAAIYNKLVPLSFFLAKKEGQGAQGERTRSERLKSKQSFLVKEGIKADVNKHSVLLLDDIYTTGRTLYYARDALQTAFPQAKISSFTICR